MTDTKDEKTYRYVKVVFDSSCWHRYSYIDENRIAAINDFVVVPVGPHNDEKIARVISVDEFTAQDAPYPIWKTKHIIRMSSYEEAYNCDESI